MPPDAIGPGSGVAQITVNRINGDAAPDAIASMYERASYSVTTEVRVHDGQRIIDVLAVLENPDPRLTIVERIEVKLGQTGYHGITPRQVMFDGMDNLTNQSVRGFGWRLSVAGDALGVAGIALDAARVGADAYSEGGIGPRTGRTASGVGGGIVLGGGGAYGGAMLGSPGGAPGMLLGGALGGIGGSLLGDWAAQLGFGALFKSYRGVSVDEASEVVKLQGRER